MQQGINRDAIFASAQTNQINQNTPFGSRYYTGEIGAPNRTENVTLDPRLQNILGGQLGVTQGMTDASQGALDRVASAPFDLTQGAADVRRAGPQSFQTSFDKGPGLQYGFESGGPLTRNVSSQFDIQNQIGDTGQIQRRVDLSGLTQIPGSSDFGAERSRVEAALSGRQRRMIDPDLQQPQDTLQPQLANQGFTPGTEGYQKAMESFGRSREMTLGNARDSAIAQAGGEQGRLFGQGLQSRQQGVAERFGTGEFGNTAQAQAYGQALGGGQFANQAQGQDFGQLFQNAQLNNAASDQQSRWNQALAQFNNDSAMSDFGRNLAGAEFGNAARGQQGQYDLNLQGADQALRQQGTGENLTQRNQGFNELAALLTGSPVQPSNPNFTNFDPRAQYNMAQGSPDVMGAYAAQQAARANILGSIFGAAGKIGSSF